MHHLQVEVTGSRQYFELLLGLPDSNLLTFFLPFPSHKVHSFLFDQEEINMAKANLFLLTILSSSTGWAFQFSPTRRSSSVALGVHTLRDADLMEMMAGGERYEMVPLPDSMVDTTLFVGNLNEFAKDEDLSDFFKTVSTLQSVPACVARKANMASMEYGFVSFPNVEEKEVRGPLSHSHFFLVAT